PVPVPALTVNRLCGSGFQGVITGAEQIALGLANCMLVGGAESMSQAPHIIRGARTGLKLGANELEDSLWAALNDTYVNMPMAITAENLAVKYNISQDEVDRYSVRSQVNHAKAKAEGLFDDELVAVIVNEGKKQLTLDHDEH